MKITSHSLTIQIPPDLADDPDLIRYAETEARRRAEQDGTPIPPGIRPAHLTGPDGRRHLHWIWLTFDDGPGRP